MASAQPAGRVPGPDLAVVTRNTLVGGRRRGMWSSLGVASAHGLHRARGLLAGRRVRRLLDAATGAALLGFGVRLTTD